MINHNDLKSKWKFQYIKEMNLQIYRGSLYHYTTRENLWNIIKSNSFYARHLRFSNDSAEYIIGKQEIEQCIGESLPDLTDQYMVCFCKKDDILSQWREYARGGVSIEMNFSEDTYYTIKCNTETENNENAYMIPRTYYTDPKEYIVVYARPIAVKYIKPGEKMLDQTVNDIKTSLQADKIEIQTGRYLKRLTPYIKHIGFKEEQEVRLVFEVSSKRTPYIVDYLEHAGIKKPYIRVEVGDASKKKECKCDIKLYNIPKELVRNIKGKMADNKLKIEYCKGKLQDINIQIKYERIKRAKQDEAHIFIGNCMYQEYVFQMIHSHVATYNSQNNKSIRIWCEGFLPIRGITVGPSSDAEELRESIVHRIKNIYWMKYVDVKVSDIPYRS